MSLRPSRAYPSLMTTYQRIEKVITYIGRRRLEQQRLTDVEVRYGFVDTPFGPALLAETARGVCHLEFLAAAGKEKAVSRLRARWPKAALKADAAAASRLSRRVFRPDGKGRVPLHLRGTAFQLKVWEALLRIPSGGVSAYGDVAKAVGLPKASRAVGSAVGENAVAYLIPCHRVIKGSGVIGDYRWGRARKRALLAWESAQRQRAGKHPEQLGDGQPRLLSVGDPEGSSGERILEDDAAQGRRES